MSSSPVALGHDYLTQRGGAERVALVMAEAFPGAPMYTTLYDREATYPEFSHLELRTSVLNRSHSLRARHRLALPLLARAVSWMRVDADVLLTSSSGWAHGLPATGRKIVYCHAPARWLYQSDRYLGANRPSSTSARLRRAPATVALALMRSGLVRWDRRAARSAHRYLANSTVTRDAIRQIYGIEAEILPPPPALLPGGSEQAFSGVSAGFYLCVARLLPYKNVDAVVEAVLQVPGARLVVVGEGPERGRLETLAAGSDRITLAGRVSDEQLRWLYRNCSALIAASYEDYGLSPLEAAAFGKPAIVLRDGGYLDTVIADQTGIFFERAQPGDIAIAIEAGATRSWDAAILRAHAAKFSTAQFQARLREIVAEERDAGSRPRPLSVARAA